MMMFLRHDESQEEDKDLKICSQPILQQFCCQVGWLCAYRYCTNSCMWCGRANAATIISWFHYVAGVLVLECPLRDPLVPIDSPCAHLAFARVDGIHHVFFKLWDIHILSNTSCKHGRQPFTRIYGMYRRIKFPRLQAGVEYFDMVYQFLRNPRCTILIIVLQQLKSIIADQAFICTLKWSNADVGVIFVTPLQVFMWEMTHWPCGLPHLARRSVFSWYVGTHKNVLSWSVGVKTGVNICNWVWGDSNTGNLGGIWGKFGRPVIAAIYIFAIDIYLHVS